MPVPAGPGTLTPTAGTAQAWIEDTRSLLMSGLQGERNTLAFNYTAGSGTLMFTGELKGIAPGVRLSVGTNTFYVRTVSEATRSATVIGGQEGTLDQDALADSLVWVAPRFTDADILQALNSDLADLSGPGNGLFQIRTVDLTYDWSYYGYDLSTVADLIDVYDVRAVMTGTSRGIARLRKQEWALDRDVDTTVFPSGLALQVYGGAYQGLPVRVLYRCGFTPLSDATTAQAATGLPTSAYDLPPWGAALQLMAAREVKRNFTEAQPDTRRAAEVPAGAVQGSYRGIAAVRQQRIQSEAAKLMARYPDRRW